MRCDCLRPLDRRNHAHDLEVSQTTNRLIQRGSAQWSLREVDAHSVPGARAPKCLICESTDVIRRLWAYPADWKSLSDDALWTLCEADQRRG
jgi:hypothetical protein